MKNVSVKHFSFFGRGSIGDQENVCQTLRASLLEGVLVIKNVSVKLLSFINGGSIGDQKCLPNFTASATGGVLVMKNVSVNTLQFLQWRQYW